MSYFVFEKAAVDYLQSKDAYSVDKNVGGPEIIEEIVKRIKNGEIELNLTEGSMISYLSRAANTDENSRIRRLSGRRGYFLSKEIHSEPSEEEPAVETVSSGGGEVSVYEKDLYPLVRHWLETKGFSAKDVSALKAGGLWGNPDILGAKRYAAFGAVEIEVSSCEVKINENNWQRFIFEAISHKRFCHRSWFCIRTPSEEFPLPKGIEYYAERYRVGIVQIILSDRELSTLRDSPRNVSGYVEKVVEKIPAVYDYVPLQEVESILSRAGYQNSLHPSSE